MLVAVLVSRLKDRDYREVQRVLQGRYLLEYQPSQDYATGMENPKVLLQRLHC